MDVVACGPLMRGKRGGGGSMIVGPCNRQSGLQAPQALIYIIFSNLWPTNEPMVMHIAQSEQVRALLIGFNEPLAVKKRIGQVYKKTFILLG